MTRRVNSPGFVQTIRYSLERLKPLSKREKAQGKSDKGRLTYHQIGILIVLAGRIGYGDTVVRTADGRGPPMTINEIAEYLGYTRQNAHKILNALEAAGAVTLKGATDQRCVAIEKHFAHRYRKKKPQEDEENTPNL